MVDIFTLPLFEKRLKHYKKKNPLLTRDFAKLLDLLEENSTPTTAIALKDKVYKIRMANSSSNKGKSAGYRVYYFYKDHKNTLLLFYMHSKNDESNINDVRLDKLIIECELFFDTL
jgi:mRNA-degrading endonuclease RelE of RelBE toxin-antitoxin system